MKVCLISSLYHPFTRGGAGIVAERVAQGFTQQGDEVFVITTQPWAATRIMRIEADYAEIKIYRFFPLNISSFLYLGKKPWILRLFWHAIDMFNLHAFFTVKKILKKEKPDLVLTHNLKGLGYTVPAAIRACGIRHIHTIHDVQLSVPSGLLSLKDPDADLCGLGGFMRIYGYFCRWLFGSPTVVVSPSQWLLDFYTKRRFFGKSKKVVLANPIECDANIPMSSYGRSPEGRHANDTNKTQLNLLYFNQLEKHKGIIFLIQALKQWQKPFHLLIIGSGSCASKVAFLIKNDSRFSWQKYDPETKTSEVFKNIDCLMVPSLCLENAPLSITDGLAHGVPVLASRIGGITEMVQDNQNGFTFKPGDKADLLKKLEKIFEMKNNRSIKLLRQNALNSVQNQTIKQYIQTLKHNV